MQLCLCKWRLLKMLGLYLYTLIISHKSCNLLSILNKLTVQKNAKVCDTSCVFGQKTNKNTTTKQKNQTLKPLPEPGIEPVTSCIQIFSWVYFTA